MTKEEAIALYRSGEEPTVATLLELDARIEALEKRMPPKEDPSVPSAMKPPYEKPPVKGRRNPPGREKGHVGVRRPTPSRIDETKVHCLSHCPQCHGPLGDPVSSRERFTEDIQEVKPLITQHIIPIFYCPWCKKSVEAPVEEALPKSTIGIRLLS